MKCFVVLFALFGACLCVDTSCLRACPMIYMPLCASNGRTYGNKCEMEAAACGLKTTLTVMSTGECPTTTTSSPTPDALTDSKQTGCLMICPFIYMPVCGTDGRTYGNECEMKARGCMTKSTITTLHQGPCSVIQ